MTGNMIKVAISACALVALTATTHTASAGIRCKGPYQILSGGSLIYTPYCGDGYLARVARTYGTRVSAKAIRNNPNKKKEVCEFVGQDIRVSEICEPYSRSVGPSVR